MKRILLVLMAVVMVYGCSSSSKDVIDDSRPLEEMYADAQKSLKKRSYREAIVKFEEVEQHYPASPWAANALINASYAAYMERDYVGTLTITDRFLRFHPGHEDVPYVLYLRGMSYMDQMSDVHREQGMAAYALATFTDLTKRFPNTDYAKNSKNKILILKNNLAGKALYTARREIAVQNYTAAIMELQRILRDGQETQMVPEALYRMTECYGALGVSDQVQVYSEILRKNYPDNDWTKKLMKIAI